MQESGVRECRHLHRNAGVQEYCSADICIGMQECRSTAVQTFASGCRSDAGVQEYWSTDICIGMQECSIAGVQTFASECRGLECGSADISLSHNLLLTPRSPFLILNS